MTFLNSMNPFGESLNLSVILGIITLPHTTKELRIFWEPIEERNSTKFINTTGEIWWRILGLAS